MSSTEELEAAWSALREHWAIEPSPQPLPKTPVYSALRMFLSPALRPLLRWRIHGADRIPRTGATILAANHLSHVDPIAVIAAARRTTHYLAKDGHFSNPMTRFVMHATGQIETHREAAEAMRWPAPPTFSSTGRRLASFRKAPAQSERKPRFCCPEKRASHDLLRLTRTPSLYRLLWWGRAK
ncbi:MAG: hypothetical protein CM15mP78_08140 [Candidatus Poseidoniales archaeon]|nr:MAG: hypothetical protein CM15mP78_08140 [Candidatus Poseidoniales archaeon]